MSDIEFHRLEEYDSSKYSTNDEVICSFKTERFGYLQVSMAEVTKETATTNKWTFSTLKNEPDLNMFTQSDVNKIEQITRIVWRMMYDVPAAKERFES